MMRNTSTRLIKKRVEASAASRLLLTNCAPSATNTTATTAQSQQWGNFSAAVSSSPSFSLSTLGCEQSQVFCHLHTQRRHLTTATRPARQSWALNAMRPWMCPSESCRSVNPAVKSECQACAKEKPQLQGWKCVKCKSRNYRGVKACKSCQEPYASSKDFWMCAVCGENNRIDELDDNSRCGFCGYDMAPLSLTEERLTEMNDRREAEFQAQQERFDSVSARDAEDQLGSPVHGAEEALPQSLRQPAPAAAGHSKLASLRPIPHFTPQPVQTRRSRLYHRPRAQSAAVPVAGTVGGGSSAPRDVIPPGPPGFDWMCCDPHCAHINPGDEECCTKCGQHIAPAEWECPQCAALNHLSRSRCFSCHAGIPVSWTCPACQTATSIYAKACLQCQALRPAVEPKNPHEVWAAERDAAGPHGNNGGGGGGSGGSLSFRNNDWYCTSCNGMNFSRRTDCYQCGTPKPATRDARGSVAPSPSHRQSYQDDMDAAAAAEAGGEPHRAEQNNWLCRHCQASNFRTRRSCWQCGKESADATGGDWATGHGGGGGFSEEQDANMPHFSKEGFQDDAESKPAEGRMNVWKKTDEWVCAKCFSKNYRGKSECHKCGAPRTLAVSPRRASVRKPVKL